MYTLEYFPLPQQLTSPIPLFAHRREALSLYSVVFDGAKFRVEREQHTRTTLIWNQILRRDRCRTHKHSWLQCISRRSQKKGTAGRRRYWVFRVWLWTMRNVAKNECRDCICFLPINKHSQLNRRVLFYIFFYFCLIFFLQKISLACHPSIDEWFLCLGAPFFLFVCCCLSSACLLFSLSSVWFAVFGGG